MYPERNPFPTQATLNIEAVLRYEVLIPSIPRAPTVRLEELTDQYLGESRDHAAGRAVAIHGENGSGKNALSPDGARPIPGAGAQRHSGESQPDRFVRQGRRTRCG